MKDNSPNSSYSKISFATGQVNSLPNKSKHLSKHETEKKVDSSTILYTKINTDFTFDYVNQDYCNTLSYQAFEVVGKRHSFMYHPDMPEIIQSSIREKLLKGEIVKILEKHITKQGSYFWVINVYTPNIDLKGNIQSFTSRATKAPSYITVKLGGLYAVLKRIENKTGSKEKSEVYLLGFLEEHNTTFKHYVETLLTDSKKYDAIEEFKERISQNTRKKEKKVLKGSVEEPAVKMISLLKGA